MTEVQKIVRVGIADMNIVKAPTKIRTSSLGSCVGVIIYDQYAKIAGMAHIMLPDSSLSNGKEITNVAKFADTALPQLTKSLLSKGARQNQLRAKIAGGAQMFQLANGNNQMRIGPRNVKAVKEELGKLKIPIIAEDVGGNSGRTIEFDPSTSILEIRTVNQGISEI